MQYPKGGGSAGEIEGDFFPNKQKKKIAPQSQHIKMPLVDLGGLPYTTTIEPGTLRQGLKFAAMQGLSPIEFQEAGLDDQGVMARGKLKPSLPMLKELEIDILVTGEDVTLSKTFTKDEFNLPGPIKVTGASLTVSVGTSGLGVSGDVFFEIERVGKGQLTGRSAPKEAWKSKASSISTAALRPGRADDRLCRGTLRIGALGSRTARSGIKSAQLTATIDGEKIDATGT